MTIRHKLAYFFTYLVAFQLLNLSIYNGEFESIQIATHHSTSVDETDSFVEFISENILQLKKVQTEAAQKNGSKQNHLHKSFQTKLYWFSSVIHDTQPIHIDKPENIVLAEDYTYLFSKEITPPPPKTLA